MTINGGRELLLDAMDLSFELRNLIYDCVYLALAARHKLPLVTADERLAGAVRKYRKMAGRVILLSELQS